MVLLLFGVTFAEVIDDDPEVVSLYAKGKRMLREKAYFEAANIFEELEARFPNSKNVDLFIFNRSKANLYGGNHSEAIAGFQYFISKFNNSELTSYAYLFLGNAYYLKGNVDRAVKSYIKGYQISSEKNLDNQLLASLKSAFENAGSVSLNESDLELLPQDKKCKLIKPLSQLYIDRGALKKANSLLMLCGESIDVDNNPQIVNQMANKLLEVALVLPVSGELNSFAQEIYNGAVIAADFYRSETGKEIKLVSYDTKGDPIEAARIVNELDSSFETDVIIGPLTSEEASVSSAVLNCSSIPMVIPAATQSGLTRLSKTSFQLAPNIDLEGITLAEYAFRQLNSDTVAIISSTSTEDIRIARAFSEHFQKMGGVVIATEYYRTRDKDFGIYLRDIKSMVIGPPQDSLFYINPNGDTLEYKIVPVNLDCLFILGSTGQLRLLLPQINYYNINANYLGSDGWGDEIIFKLGDDITRQVVFASPFLESEQSEEYIKFAAAYDRRYGKPPQRLASLGYDAMKIITIAASQRGVSREIISEELSKISGYFGASGEISFGEFRENIEMPLYRIELEEAKKLGQTKPKPEVEKTNIEQEK